MITNKGELAKDTRFKSICLNYGADWNKIAVFDDMYILNTAKANVFVLLDEDYDTIGIYKRVDELNKRFTIPERLRLYRKMYKDNNEVLPYPFNKISLEQLIKLSKRIEVVGRKNGYLSDIIVNNEIVTDDENSNCYKYVLLYIKFIGEQIERYNKELFHMRMMGFKYPTVFEYVNKLVHNINEYVSNLANEDKRPYPIDIVNRLGEERKNSEVYGYQLHGIINLLLNEIGLKIEHENKRYQQLVKTEERNGDLSIIIKKLTKLLDVPLEANETEEEFSESALGEINIESWLAKLDKENRSKKIGVMEK